MTEILINRRMDRREWLTLLLLSVLWGGSFLFAGIQVRALPPFTIVFLRVGIAAVIFNLLVLALAKSMPRAAAIGSAVFSTALGYVLYFRILATAGATNLLLVTFLVPASAIVLGAAVLGEHLELRHFAGLAIIGAGLAAIDGRWLSWRTERA